MLIGADYKEKIIGADDKARKYGDIKNVTF